jgi:hypothetical protein
MPDAPILGNYAELHQQDWLAVDVTVAHWLACRGGQNAAATAKARQQASEAVTRAMLHDAMGIVCKTVDNRKPISERRPAAPMAQSLIQSIFSHHNFTILIQSHQNARTVNLRTWLTRHIHWKLGERFKHEKAVRQLADECGFTIEYDDTALQHQVADAEAAYQIKQGWQHFERVLNKLEQQVLWLFWNGVNDAQASQQLGIKVGAYTGNRDRALRKLRMEVSAS